MLPFNKQLTYRQLCEVFELEPKRGGYIQRQIDKISEDYEVNKVARKYVILRKYTDKEKELMHAEKLRQTHIKANLELLLCTLFTIPKKCKVVKFGMIDLLKILKVVNYDYCSTRNYINMSYAMELLDADKTIEDFFSESYSMLTRIVKDTLKDLEDKQIIMVTQTPVIARVIYKNGKAMYTKKELMDTVDKKDKFLQASRKILTEKYNTERISDIYKRRQYDSYVHDVAKEFKGDYFYKQYELTLNTKDIGSYATTDVEYKEKVNKLCNSLVAKKLLISKQGKMEILPTEDKQKYIDVFIDINNDYKLRDKYKELKGENNVQS